MRAVSATFACGKGPETDGGGFLLPPVPPPVSEWPAGR